MKTTKITFGCALVAAGLLAGSAATSHAVPLLQLYIEGATYNEADESWEGDFTDGDTLRVWTIGNISGENGKGTISDVKLAIAYVSSDTPTITVSESQTDGFGGFTDNDLANTATFSQTVTDGSNPQLSNGADLPGHGIYGSGTSWTEYHLGDFDNTSDLGGDFLNSLPTPTTGYDINVYEITISGTSEVHFDLYDSIAAGNHIHAKFAPFSHDGEGRQVPDGGATVALLGLVCIGVHGLRRKIGV